MKQTNFLFCLLLFALCCFCSTFMFLNFEGCVYDVLVGGR